MFSCSCSSGILEDFILFAEYVEIEECRKGRCQDKTHHGISQMVIQEKYDPKEYGGQDADPGSESIYPIDEIKAVY